MWLSNSEKSEMFLPSVVYVHSHLTWDCDNTILVPDVTAPVVQQNLMSKYFLYVIFSLLDFYKAVLLLGSFFTQHSLMQAVSTDASQPHEKLTFSFLPNRRSRSVGAAQSQIKMVLMLCCVRKRSTGFSSCLDNLTAIVSLFLVKNLQLPRLDYWKIVKMTIYVVKMARM